MQFLYELSCPQCQCDFNSASEILKHFATHASGDDVELDNQCFKSTKKLPKLHPICTKIKNKSSEENVNPLIFCEVSLDDDKEKNIATTNFDGKTCRKYECSYCKKIFGWSTDLKRHLLTHTGEKPFRCKVCSLSYTRKSILNKHIDKHHRKSKIPDLKPITIHFKSKIRNS